MIKTILKIVLYVSIIGFIISLGVSYFNYTPLINGFNQFGLLKDFIVYFVELFFNNSYIMIFLTISILLLIFRKMFF